jgi:hypothetical protein
LFQSVGGDADSSVFSDWMDGGVNAVGDIKGGSALSLVCVVGVCVGRNIPHSVRLPVARSETRDGMPHNTSSGGLD